MDGKSLARITAVIFVAVAVTATALEMSRKEGKPAVAMPVAPASTALDPLRDGLRRCQILGEAALRDDGCARLWTEQRDRFLGLQQPFASSPREPANPRSPDAASQETR
ncbi:putative entry exclusion protein TrbK-alt [Mesorhizobium sp. M1E.F.Ca.ET.063.01.1.1]|uniref:putative entry exclusion protein TrbK-alt n=1 Tax=Mesorhizobium sp. M1E.F.Ca.ET.063.01.1.1 TaxID=2496750 RepID=UPI000FC9B7FF|nr:putative entry exclusion protein TrbK-alt [Mesorhizobium sp. M1E.F.Ca.ET.063.01.1.1]RUW85457.1 conjugal transfer protein TrbK [Mesorhizobium sp. M1E.F.Ca.ET.063.01.1.1]